MSEYEGEALGCTGLVRSFVEGTGYRRVLRGVDLSVRKGEFVALLGQSGSGKSTLLHLLGLLDEPASRWRDALEVPFPKAVVWALLVLCLCVLSSGLMFVGALAGGQDWAWGVILGALLGAGLCAVLVLVWLLRQWLRVRQIPNGGTIRVLGTPTERLTRRRRNHLRNAHLGFVFQFYHLLPELNVLQNVLLPLRIGSFLPPRGAKERARRVLEQLKLKGHEHDRVQTLSGGERQRVALARALVGEPKILLCDEPTGNLDQETGSDIIGLIEKLWRERQLTLIVVTHDEQLARRAQRVLRLEEGVLKSWRS